ncbi:MAG: MGMT family protein [Bacteroidota bacterium]
MQRKSSFYEDVYEVVRLIPRGRVTSYGAIANYLGSKGSARMVGYAMNMSFGNPDPVPAHRVVNRVGLLTGRHHFATPTAMQEALEAEGIIIKEHQIQNFERVFWDPAVALGI